MGRVGVCEVFVWWVLGGVGRVLRGGGGRGDGMGGGGRGFLGGGGEGGRMGWRGGWGG